MPLSKADGAQRRLQSPSFDALLSGEAEDLIYNAQVTPNGERVTWVSRNRLLALVASLSRVETLTNRRWRVDVARDCNSPVSITLGYRPDRNVPSGRFMYRGYDACLFLHMEVMCRRPPRRVAIHSPGET